MQLPSWHACGVLALLACSACSRSEPPRPAAAATPARAPAAPDDGAALILPDLMAFIVDPAAGVLLAAADAPAWHTREPRSAEAWQAVADAAGQLAQTAAALAQPALATGRSDWLQWAASLHAGAAEGGTAAQRRDPHALAAAAARVRTACQACHARHAPDVAAPR